MRGDVKADPLDPAALAAGADVALGPSSNSKRLQIQTSRRHNKLLILHFAGVDTLDAARALGGSAMFVRRSELPELPATTFRALDLFGFEVKDRLLGSLGKVSGVRHYPACDMLVVGPKDLLVPMLAAYGVTVDRKKKEIAIVLPAGFEEL